MGLWYHETFDGRTQLSLRVERTLFSGRSDYQTVEVVETAQFGRMLVIDGVFMTSEGDEFYYHEMLVHPAMTTVKSPKRVLVLGGGDGGTVREVLRHSSVEKVVMVEIDELVVRASRDYLPSIGTAWDDPRLDVRFEDAIVYVRESADEPYDVVLLDGTDPIGPGEVLYRQEFYEGCKRMVRDGGVFALQSESPILFLDTFLGIQRNLGSLFATVRPYFGPVPLYGAGTWSWTYASDAADPLQPTQERLRSVEPHLRYYNEDIHRGAFALPSYLRNTLTK